MVILNIRNVFDPKHQIMFELWTYTMGGVDSINHALVCSQIWPILESEHSLNAPQECEYYMNDTDYNGMADWK